MGAERGDLGLCGLKRPPTGMGLSGRHVGYDWTEQELLLHEGATISLMLGAASTVPFMTHRNQTIGGFG